MTPRHTGTIIKIPDSTPGLLIVEGQQKPFTLEGVWKSPVAPAINMAVDVELDGAGLITGLTAVNLQQTAATWLEKTQQGIGAFAARMGKAALVATVILWIAWFFLPTLTIQQFAASQTFTFWDFLALGLSNEAVPLQFVLASHGLLSIIGLAAIAAPFAAPFLRRPRAKFLYAMPLLYLILTGVSVAYDVNHAIGEAVDTAERSVTYDPGNPAYNRQQQLALQGVQDRLEQSLMNSISIGYGAFVIGIASLSLAVQVLGRPGYENAGSVLAGDVASTEAGIFSANIVAALTYLLGFITGLIFLFLKPYNQDEFVRFHARQSIGFSVARWAIWIVFRLFTAVLPYGLGSLLSKFIWTPIDIALWFFWAFLMYKAYKGERYRIPWLADTVDSFAGTPAA
jgi:uncharacterized membrane protein